MVSFEIFTKSPLLTRLASLERPSGGSVINLGLAAFGLALVYVFALAVYRIFFHPLRSYPGPLLAAITDSYRHWYMIRGANVHNILECHKRYGPVIRYGPNQILYTDAQAWKDIYGHRVGGKQANKKQFLPERYPGHQSVIGARTDENHGRQRRIFSHAFSDQSLRKQEPMFKKYVVMLVDNLSRQIADEPEKKFNLVDYLNFTTFDVMGDLTFAEPLGMLESSTYSPWVKMVFASIKASTMFFVARQYPPFSFLLRTLVPREMKKMREKHIKFSEDRVDRRLEKEVDDPDIWKLVLKQEGDRALTKKEMYLNAELFMVAGTETTATQLSGMTYYLLKTPRAMARLRAELQEAFPDGENVSGDKLASLPYLHACIEEGLRVFPPVPLAITRITPPEGNAIMGEWLPGNTEVGISQLAANHSPANFGLSDEFWPERWLPEGEKDAQFVNDSRAAMQAFSVGPRNCLGRNMAWYEMRLIAALLLLNFEIELCEESKRWHDQKIFALWEKKPLMVKLRQRQA